MKLSFLPLSSARLSIPSTLSIHSFKNYLSNSYFVSGTMISSGDRATKKQNPKSQPLWNLYSILVLDRQ